MFFHIFQFFFLPKTNYLSTASQHERRRFDSHLLDLDVLPAPVCFSLGSPDCEGQRHAGKKLIGDSQASAAANPSVLVCLYTAGVIKWPLVQGVPILRPVSAEMGLNR